MTHTRRLPRVVLACAVLAGSLAFSVAPGAADPIADKKAEAARVAAAIDAGARQVADLARQTNRAKAALGDTESALAASTAQATQAEQRVADTKDRLATQAVDAYVHGASAGLIADLMNSRGPDLAVRKQYVTLAAGDDRQAIDDLRAARQDLAAKNAGLSRLKASRAATLSQLKTRTAALAKAEDNEKARLGQVQGQLAALVAADQARRDAAAAARARLAALAAAAPRGRSWPGAPPGWAPLGGTFACIRQMESGDNYSEPGGGAYQFLDSTWHSLGQPGTASDAPPWVQDAMAVALQARSGWGQWTTAPLCGR